MTPYQSEDPSPTLPTYKGKEEKGKIVEDKKERATRPTLLNSKQRGDHVAAIILHTAKRRV